MIRKVTAQDVADLAGVSRSAVSLVLNGRAKGSISAVKQKAVLEAARRLNYTPNAVAQSLRASKTGILGLLTWRSAGGLPLHLMAATLQTSSLAGYKLIKMYAEPTEHDQYRALSTLGHRQVDGMLVVAPELCQYEAVEALSTVPLVLLNCVDPAQSLPSVFPDEEAAGAQAAQLLIDQGHRLIAFVSGPLTQYQTALRVSGAQRALAAAGLPPAHLQSADVRVDAGRAAALALLTGDEPPTALICCHERLAVGASFAAAELRLELPADLSMVSLDDREELAGQLHPVLTRVERPDEQMAAHAAELLIEQLESETPLPARCYSFICPVAEGASIAPPRH